MRRFYLSPDALTAPEPVLTGPDANHIKNVLRLQPGHGIAVFDGQGNAWEANIRTVDPDRVTIALGNPLPSHTDGPAPIILAQALLKANKMDPLVRQITELGVAHWAPFMAERSVPSPDSKRMEKKRSRWRTIAQEALKQCGRNRMPEINGIVSFDHILTMSKDCDVRLIFWEDETAPVDLRSLAQAIPRPGRILIILGPEGGFTPSEIARARTANLQCATLGPRILRAETATLAACTLIQFLFGDLGPQ